jgi:hypothetical protein
VNPAEIINEAVDSLQVPSLGTREGKLVLPEPEDAVEFASMVVETPEVRPPIKESSRPEIIVGPVTIDNC